jgi:ribose transport system permease protein
VIEGGDKSDRPATKVKIAEVQQNTTQQPSGRSRWQGGLARLVSVHSLLILAIAAVIGFSIAQPSTFPTSFNIKSVLSSNSALAMLALAEMIVLAAGEFDLSVGYAVGLVTIIVVWLVTHGVGTVLSVVIGLALGTTIGLINGLIVTFAKIDSFIATLATGTVLYGISNWMTNGVEIEGTVPNGFSKIANGSIGPIPLPAVYVAVAAIIIWILFEYFPVGRHLYALGANRKAAELVGIRPRRYVLGAFLATGFLVGAASVMTASLVQVGNPALGPEYLLPAFVAALLGATSVRPGRVNAGGTIIAVLLLAVVLSGLEHLGAQFFVESVFDGGTLLIATGLAGYAARRRLQSRAEPDPASKAVPEPVSEAEPPASE